VIAANANLVVGQVASVEEDEEWALLIDLSKQSAGGEMVGEERREWSQEGGFCEADSRGRWSARVRQKLFAPSQTTECFVRFCL